MMKILLMGPPGSGKGTQASHIANLLDVNSISTGDLFRNNLANGTELGKLAQGYMERGEYVPDKVTINMIMGWVGSPVNSCGFVLDGFPRTIKQAEELDRRLDSDGIDKVVFFDVGFDELVDRLTGRLICRECQRPYHRSFAPPMKEKTCDLCSGNLYQRDDDKIEVVRNRLKVYEESTEPVLKYYDKNDKLQSIDASRSIEFVRIELTSLIQEMCS